jgi:hypothetical protein
MPWYIHTIGRCYDSGLSEEMREERGGTVYTKYVRAVCEPYPFGRINADG